MLIVEGYRAIFLLCDRALVPGKGLLANQATQRQLFHCGRGRSANHGKILFAGSLFGVGRFGIKKEDLTVKDKVHVLRFSAFSGDNLTTLVLSHLDQF